MKLSEYRQARQRVLVDVLLRLRKPSASKPAARPAKIDSHEKPGIGTGGVGNGKPPGVVVPTVTVEVVTGAVTLNKAEAVAATFVTAVTT